MRTRAPLFGVLAALCAASGSSSCSDRPIVGPDTSSARYALRFVASAECPTTGAGVMSRTQFEFEVTENADARMVFVLREPFNQQPNTGDLTLRLSGSAPVTGTLGGFGLSSNGIETFGVWATRERSATAAVEGRALPSGGFEGTFSGYVTYSVFRTAGGGECTASGHSWRLSPLR